MGDYATLAKHAWKTGISDPLWESISLLAWLKEGQRLEVSGQDMKEARYNSNDGEDLVYGYGDDTPVVAGQVDEATTATFQWKAARMDTYVKEREMLTTKGMSEVGVDFVKEKMERAKVHFKRYFNKRLLGLSGTTTDASEDFQGIRDALTHDLTYGGVTRATTVTNSEFQGGSLAGTYADQAMTYPASIATVRDMQDVCNEFEPDPGELVLFVGRLPFRELQGQVEGSVSYSGDKNGALYYGKPTFYIDDIRVVMDYHLAEKYATGASRWAFMLNRKTWNFRLHPQRNFDVSPFKMQDEQIGGVPVAMSTIKIFGNCWCSHPGGNIWVPVFGS